MLDISYGVIFWASISFLIVLFILAKFAWKPILNGLKEREETIANALNEAEKARQEMEKLNASNEAMAKEARIEREKILAEAREKKDSIVSEARNEAKSEAEKVMATARQEIESQKKAAIAELKSQVGAMSLEVAEKVIRQNLSNDSAQKELVNTLVNEVKMN